MKIIFLDIDGVLNDQNSIATAEDGAGIDGWKPDAVRQLKRILAETGAEIVISSTWRLGIRLAAKNADDSASELKKGFKRFDLPAWVGVTPRKLSNCHRGFEIQMYLDKHPEVNRYVIIDDDSNMLEHQTPFFVKTEFWSDSNDTALTKERADRAIEILNQ